MLGGGALSSERMLFRICGPARDVVSLLARILDRICGSAREAEFGPPRIVLFI